MTCITVARHCSGEAMAEAVAGLQRGLLGLACANDIDDREKLRLRCPAGLRTQLEQLSRSTPDTSWEGRGSC